MAYGGNRDTFRFAELYAYLSEQLEIKKTALSWHLEAMMKDGIVAKVGRGIYKILPANCRPKQAYQPETSLKAKNVYKEIRAAFPYIDVSVFCGDFLARLQHHISTNHAIYVEVSRDATEPVFHHLKGMGLPAYHRPDAEFVYENIDLREECFIVKPLVSESPLMEADGVATPRLEKILVDVFCDSDLSYLQGAEAFRIVANAVSLFDVNRSTLMRYASRRNVKGIIETAVNQSDQYD